MTDNRVENSVMQLRQDIQTPLNQQNQYQKRNLLFQQASLYLMFFDCTQDGCGKVFNCKKALKEHERTHNQDRPFKCELCDQTFTQYSSLQKHARVHDKKKPFKCNNNGCNQAFSQVSNLIRHQRIHTGEKPYECEICGKQFASGSNLKQHVQIHERQDNRNQYKCIFQGCDKSYLYPSSLKKHYTVSHKEEYDQYLRDEQIETCGFHLRSQEPFSSNLKINDPSDQTLESNLDNQSHPKSNNEAFLDAKKFRQSAAFRAQPRFGSDKLAGLSSLQQEESSLMTSGLNSLLPAKRGYQVSSKENPNYLKHHDSDQISKALEGTAPSNLKRLKASDILPSNFTLPNQQQAPPFFNSFSALNEFNNGKMSEEQKNLFMTCHMYFINNQNNHNSGQHVDPQLNQSLQDLKGHFTQLQENQKSRLHEAPQSIDPNNVPLVNQDPKLVSSQSSSKGSVSAMSNITNQAKINQDANDALANQHQIDPSIRHQSKLYNNSLVQQVQNILEQQNQQFNKSMESHQFMTDSYNYQGQNAQYAQATLPLNFPRPMMQQTGTSFGLNSPACNLQAQVNQNHNSRLERASNNSHSILSPSIYIRPSLVNNNHGSNNSNHSLMRPSQFKYKASRLSEIRKPTPLNGAGLSIHQSSVSEDNKSVNQDNAAAGGSSFNRKSSQFYQAEGTAKNEPDNKEVEYEENDEQEEEAVAAQRVPVEQNLLQANLTQELEDLNKQSLPPFVHSLSATFKSHHNTGSAFQQVRKPNPYSIGHSGFMAQAGMSSNMALKRSSSENSLNVGSDNLQLGGAAAQIQDLRKSFFYNQSAMCPGAENSKDQSYDQSAFSSKNLDSIAQSFSTLRNLQQHQFREKLSQEAQDQAQGKQ